MKGGEEVLGSRVCSALPFPHLACKYSALHHQLQERCGGKEPVFVPVCVRVCVWEGGFDETSDEAALMLSHLTP